MALTPRPVSTAPSSRRAAITGSTDSSSALTRAILPAALTHLPAGSTIHHMMSSSSDELLRNGVEPAIDVQNLRVIRGKRVALDEHLGSDRAGHHHRPARPVGLRQDDADAQHRRHTDRRRGHGDGAGPPGRFGRTAPPRRLRHAGPHHLQRPADHRQRALLRRAVRHGLECCGSGGIGRRPGGPPNSVVRQPIRRSAHPSVVGLRTGGPPRSVGARRTHRRA